jgi:uncharacterized membrane protein YqaE (UPF0057 family)
MDGYDGLEQKILDGKYRITDKALYGGLMFGGFVLPVNFFKILFTTIFPPLGEILNIIGDFMVDEFPYIKWEGLLALLYNFQRVVYSFILTSMLYIPGLIYTLSNIKNYKNIETNEIIRIKKY